MSIWAEVAVRAVAGSYASSDGERRGHCPFCPERQGSEDRHKSLSVNLGRGAFYCHRCGAKGRFSSADEELEEPGLQILAVEPPPEFVSLCSPDGMQSWSLAPAREFLLDRGLAPEAWEAGGIGACASGFLAGRVVVPIRDSADKPWRGWVGRSWVKDPAGSKYLYAKGMQRAEVLYNADALDLVTSEPVLVVEGVLDAISVGLGCSVAVLGKTSAPQVELLLAANRPVAIVFDGDAWRDGAELALRLQFEGLPAGSVRLPPKRDPDEVDKLALLAAARACIGEAEPTLVIGEGGYE